MSSLTLQTSCPEWKNLEIATSWLFFFRKEIKFEDNTDILHHNRYTSLEGVRLVNHLREITGE